MMRRYWRRCLWVIAAIALFFTGKVIYVMLYSLVLVYWGARFITRKGFENLVVKRELNTGHLFRGEEFVVSVHAHNKSWAPLVSVSTTDELPLGLFALTPRKAVYALSPGQQVTFSYRVQGRFRGVFPIGPLHVEAGDPWGLEMLRGRVDLCDEVIVYPKVHHLSDIGLPSSLPIGEIQARQRFFEDPARTSGVREYQPGDPLKRMHWKASARSGRLHVREFEPTIALETTLFLDLNEEAYDVHLIDHMSEFSIEVAASLAYFLHRQRQPVGLVTNGRDGPAVVGSSDTNPIRMSSRKGASQLMKIMEALARVQVHRGKPMAQLLADEARQLPWASTILVITPIDSPDIVKALLSLRHSGYLITVFLTGDRIIHPGFLTHPPMPGLTFLRCRHSGELDALGSRRNAD
jgi:uncharacterized protein (DUF58 family)